MLKCSIKCLAHDYTQLDVATPVEKPEPKKIRFLFRELRKLRYFFLLQDLGTRCKRTADVDTRLCVVVAISRL
jgi:hypothetical protein